MSLQETLPYNESAAEQITTKVSEGSQQGIPFPNNVT